MPELFIAEILNQSQPPTRPPEDQSVADKPMSDEHSTTIDRVDHPEPPSDATPSPVEQGSDFASFDEETSTGVTSDFPEVTALSKRTEFTWDDDKAPVDNFAALGKTLEAEGDLYRSSNYGARVGPRFEASQRAADEDRQPGPVAPDHPGPDRGEGREGGEEPGWDHPDGPPPDHARERGVPPEVPRRR